MSLTIKNLSKSFDEKTLFRDFSYSFEDSGIYVISGESGVGKTTLLRIIAGLDKNYSGTVTGGGFDNVSVCFQENRLFPHLSAFNNVFMVSFSEETEENKNKVRALLKRLNLTDKDMELYPSELSGGMRQRIAFARAVLKNSSILILDEATKELDSALKSELLTIIKEESDSRLVIMVTHDPEEIKLLSATVVSLS